MELACRQLHEYQYEFDHKRSKRPEIVSGRPQTLLQAGLIQRVHRFACDGRYDGRAGFVPNRVCGVALRGCMIPVNRCPHG
jgi:hypothetical protein